MRTVTVWLGFFALSVLPSSAQVLDLAKQAFDAGDYRKAIQYFEQSQQQEERCEVFFYIGVSRYRLSRIDDAIADFQKSATCDPNLFEAHVALAEGYVQKGNDAQALHSFEQALRVRPDDSRIMRAAVLLYVRHEMNDKALPLLKKLVAQNDNDAELHADLGAVYGAIGDYGSAEQEFRKALRLQSTSPAALTGLANLQLQQGSFESAIGLLEEAVRTAPNAAEAHFLLGSAYNDAQRFEDAVRELNEAARLQGKDPEIYYHLVRAYGRLGLTAERSQALAKFSELKQQSLDDADRRREAAKLLDQSKELILEGKLVEAADLTERSHALAPDSPEAAFRLAGIRYDLRQYELARESAQDALKMAPSDFRPHLLLGLIEKDLGNLAVSAKNLETAASLHPNGAEIQAALGQVSLAVGDRAKARMYFERAAELEPNNQQYKAYLAETIPVE